MTQDLFDRRLRAIRRDRAARMGPDLFLLDRAFEDCLDRLRDIPRSFDHALLVGCPSPSWREQLGQFARKVDVVDPGGAFAAGAGGIQAEEDRFDFGEERYDLCLAVGTLDTVNDLPQALRLLNRALRPDSPLVGAIAGGNSLPSLRASLIDAGRSVGKVVARAHPRIEPNSLAGLLLAAGFRMQVVDIDRVRIRYEKLDQLVRDLRAMGATSALKSRPGAFSRAEAAELRRAFGERGNGERVEEVVEILHFLGWRS